MRRDPYFERSTGCRTGIGGRGKRPARSRRRRRNTRGGRCRTRVYPAWLRPGGWRRQDQDDFAARLFNQHRRRPRGVRRRRRVGDPRQDEEDRQDADAEEDDRHLPGEDHAVPAALGDRELVGQPIARGLIVQLLPLELDDLEVRLVQVGKQGACPFASALAETRIARQDSLAPDDNGLGTRWIEANVTARLRVAVAAGP